MHGGFGMEAYVLFTQNILIIFSGNEDRTNQNLVLSI